MSSNTRASQPVCTSVLLPLITCLHMTFAAHIGCYNLPYSIREQLKGRRKIDENTNLDGASLIGFSIVHPERKDAKVTDGNGCLLEEVIKVYDCEGKLAAESLIIAESSTGKRKRGE